MTEVESRPDRARPVAAPAVDLGALAQAVQGCPAVAGLHPGSRGAIATRTPHGWLAGLALHERILVVGVVGFWPHCATAVTEQVHAAVATHAEDLYVLVTVFGSHRHESRILRRPAPDSAPRVTGARRYPLR